MKLAFLALTIFALTMASTIPAHAAGDLKVTNQNGIMYVTAENDASASGSELTATATGTTAITPIKVEKGYAPDFGSVINFALRLVIMVAVLLVFFSLIMGGLSWITSGGDKTKTETARNRIVAAVIGLIVLASSYAVLSLVVRFLGFNDINAAIGGVGTINEPGVTIFTSPSPTASASSQLQELNKE